jgi:hypothetical protein
MFLDYRNVKAIEFSEVADTSILRKVVFTLKKEAVGLFEILVTCYKDPYGIQLRTAL